MFEDLYTLSVPLPEDILKAKGGGDYALVMRLIDNKCADPCLPDRDAARKDTDLCRMNVIPARFWRMTRSTEIISARSIWMRTNTPASCQILTIPAPTTGTGTNTRWSATRCEKQHNSSIKTVL